MAKVHAKITVVPAEGDIKRSSHEVEVEPTGAKLSDVLRAAGIDARKMQVTVDGTVVADLETYIVKGADIKVAPKPVDVRCTERASGS